MKTKDEDWPRQLAEELKQNSESNEQVAEGAPEEELMWMMAMIMERIKFT